jgi:hypothetical protein
MDFSNLPSSLKILRFGKISFTYFRMFCIFVLCLIVVPLPAGKNEFAFKFSNNKIINKFYIFIIRKKIFTVFDPFGSTLLK